MTGWRLGWIVAPTSAAETLDRLAQNLFIAAPTLSQFAACAAFDPETTAVLDERRRIFDQRRHVLLSWLSRLGFGVEGTPRGAFYVYARLPDAVAVDSMTYAAHLLEESGVAVTPGADFGEFQAGRHIRFAYTCDRAEIEGALRRMHPFRS
jgi:aspartate/methionine/tyrosine aminotransferase